MIAAYRWLLGECQHQAAPSSAWVITSNKVGADLFASCSRRYAHPSAQYPGFSSVPAPRLPICNATSGTVPTTGLEREPRPPQSCRRRTPTPGSCGVARRGQRDGSGVTGRAGGTQSLAGPFFFGISRCGPEPLPQACLVRAGRSTYPGELGRGRAYVQGPGGNARLAGHGVARRAVRVALPRPDLACLPRPSLLVPALRAPDHLG